MLEGLWRKGNPPALLVGMSTGTTTMENSMEVPQKTKYRTTIWPSNPTPEHLDKTCLGKDTCTPMFIVALSTIAKPWKQPKCPSTDEWIKKMWYIYTMEYYSAIKNNKIMSFATTWMELETLILSEICQKEKCKDHVISNIEHKATFPQKRNSCTWRKVLRLPRGRGREWDRLAVWG